MAKAKQARKIDRKFLKDLEKAAGKRDAKQMAQLAEEIRKRINEMYSHEFFSENESLLLELHKINEVVTSVKQKLRGMGSRVGVENILLFQQMRDMLLKAALEMSRIEGMLSEYEAAKSATEQEIKQAIHEAKRKISSLDYKIRHLKSRLRNVNPSDRRRFREMLDVAEKRTESFKKWINAVEKKMKENPLSVYKSVRAAMLRLSYIESTLNKVETEMIEQGAAWIIEPSVNVGKVDLREVEKHSKHLENLIKEVRKIGDEITTAGKLIHVGNIGSFIHRAEAAAKHLAGIYNHVLKKERWGKISSHDRDLLASLLYEIVNVCRQIVSIGTLFSDAVTQKYLPASRKMKNWRFIDSLAKNLLRLIEIGKYVDEIVERVDEIQKVMQLGMDEEIRQFRLAYSNFQAKVPKDYAAVDGMAKTMKYAITEERIEGETEKERIESIAKSLKMRSGIGLLGTFGRGKPTFAEQAQIAKEIENLLESASNIARRVREEFETFMNSYIRMVGNIEPDAQGNADIPQEEIERLETYLRTISEQTEELKSLYKVIKDLEASAGGRWRKSGALPLHTINKALSYLRRTISEFETALGSIEEMDVFNNNYAHMVGVSEIFQKAIAHYHKAGEIVIKKGRLVGSTAYALARKARRPFSAVSSYLKEADKTALGMRAATYAPRRAAELAGKGLKGGLHRIKAWLSGESQKPATHDYKRAVGRWKKRLKSILKAAKKKHDNIDIEEVRSRVSTITTLIDNYEQLVRMLEESGWEDSQLISEIDNQAIQIEKEIDDLEAYVGSITSESGGGFRRTLKEAWGAAKRGASQFWNFANGVYDHWVAPIIDHFTADPANIINFLFSILMISIGLIISNIFLVGAINRYSGNSAASLPMGNDALFLTILFVFMLWEQLGIKKVVAKVAKTPVVLGAGVVGGSLALLKYGAEKAWEKTKSGARKVKEKIKGSKEKKEIDEMMKEVDEGKESKQENEGDEENA